MSAVWVSQERFSLHCRRRSQYMKHSHRAGGGGSYLRQPIASHNHAQRAQIYAAEDDLREQNISPAISDIV